MSYKHRAVPSQSSTSGQKLATALLAALPMMTVLGATTALSGCGFQLRGYETPMLLDVAKTAVIIEDDRTSFPLKLPLTQRLKTLGAEVMSNMTLDDVARNNRQALAEPIAVIDISNVRFKRYELVGVLTEIRLVLSADVSYQTFENGKPVILKNAIQVDRSYQYNEASVSTDDQQGDQIRDWLYERLARRITDQYVAISLPKVPPAGKQAVPMINSATAPTVMVPNAQ
ncbi:MAG: LPS-assembly lipoprotein LptE [Psychrobacter celer]|uniref:LPS-assembly lipoprotein LptE n=1 Tax=Psychrobacter celer TaxID=306572 RepID=UPI003FB66A39